ncbi:MAG: hypothetical protein WBJ13_15100 [Sedimentibacter sp.]
MKSNLIVDSCVDFNVDTENLERVPFRILIDNEEIIDENLDLYELIKEIKIFKIILLIYTKCGYT